MIAREKKEKKEAGEWKILTGNHAVSYAAKLARVQVVPAYPITPQTTIVELISELIASGEMNARMIRVESEHSAMAAAIGASAVGARVFTATASQGLLLMHEMLHWASGSRTPVGMAVVNRALGPPWNIHVDHQDAISQRDTGWIISFVSSNQEALDAVITLYKVAEHPEVLLPFMVCLDGFVLSHTYMPVYLPPQDEIDEFLPPYDPPHWKLDPSNPISFGPLVLPDQPYQEMRWSIQKSMEKALSLFEKYSEEYGKLFDLRHGGTVNEYRMEDADYLIITSGTLASEAEVAVDKMRKDGKRVGLLKIRLYRPFPSKAIKSELEGKSGAIVIDRSISFGFSGPLSEDVRASLHSSGLNTPVVSYVTGLGGRDITFSDIENMVSKGISLIERKKTPLMIWYKMREVF
ncbi:MAG TPA: pyruvate ferredoxin oxidoreductase [Candidatus Korarchaeota archaeon]|nr:pyruvate ferredoxin oxidoreductase [Candidatus Korarchaeota archaeon]